MSGGSHERHPTTVGAAWDHLLSVLEEQSVCYQKQAGSDPGGRILPVRSDGVECGLAVYNAVELMQESGRWTREQILAVASLCKWVAMAARAEG
jgi:hypothetical protein